MNIVLFSNDCSPEQRLIERMPEKALLPHKLYHSFALSELDFAEEIEGSPDLFLIFVDDDSKKEIQEFQSLWSYIEKNHENSKCLVVSEGREEENLLRRVIFNLGPLEEPFSFVFKTNLKHVYVFAFSSIPPDEGNPWHTFMNALNIVIAAQKSRL